MNRSAALQLTFPFLRHRKDKPCWERKVEAEGLRTNTVSLCNLVLSRQKNEWNPNHHDAFGKNMTHVVALAFDDHLNDCLSVFKHEPMSTLAGSSHVVRSVSLCDCSCECVGCPQNVSSTNSSQIQISPTFYAQTEACSPPTSKSEDHRCKAAPAAAAQICLPTYNAVPHILSRGLLNAIPK